MSCLKGKKTIIGGILVMAGAVAAVFVGRLDPTFGTVVFGFGASIAGYGDKANRHQAEILEALTDIAKVAADRGDKGKLAADLEIVATEARVATAGDAK